MFIDEKICEPSLEIVDYCGVVVLEGLQDHKAFRTQFRGVGDIKFFMFRLATLYS